VLVSNSECKDITRIFDKLIQSPVRHGWLNQS